MKEMHVTHYGLMYGVVPVKMDFTNTECPEVAGRWLGCEVLLTLFDSLFHAFCWLTTAIEPDFEPMFPIKITKVVDPKFDGIELGE